MKLFITRNKDDYDDGLGPIRGLMNCFLILLYTTAVVLFSIYLLGLIFK